MRKIVLVTALALGGCATMQGTNISVEAKKIQDAVRIGCSFVPTVQTIVSIINASAGSTIGIANDICMAITSVPLADGGKRKVVVRGVPVAGRKVR